MYKILKRVHGKILAIVGPTGVGKSKLAISIAKKFNGEIINADAMQLYSGMDIGTAKLSIKERENIPHYLLNVLDIKEESNVKNFQKMAIEKINFIKNKGKLPIIVGGSGLYIKSTLDDFKFPSTNHIVRKKYEKRISIEGNLKLHNELEKKDPIAAKKIKIHDSRRIVRALEVCDLEGRPFSSFSVKNTYKIPTIQIGLELDRDLLYRYIAKRVYNMWASGFLQEVEYLDSIGLREGRTSSQAIGYSQALSYIDNMITIDQAKEEMLNLTKKLAKRQLTWFKKDPRIYWFNALNLE